MKWSDKQLRVYKEWDETTNNIVIEACPGGAKTTVLLEITKRTPIFKKSIFLAFNKSIQEELSLKVANGVDCFTLHSLGYRTLLKHTSNRYKLTEIKSWILGKKCLDLKRFKDKKKESLYLFVISKLVDLYRLNLCQNKEGLSIVADKYGVDYFNGELDDVMTLIKYLEKYNKTHFDKEPMMIDYVDMLYLPTILVSKENFPKYDVVLVDELQDISSLQWELIQKLFKPRTRFVGVGDPFQTIYSFQGADKEVFTKIKSMPRTTVLPLSYSYRCGTRIVEEANKVFNFIESPEGQHEGEVIYNGNLDDIKEGDFVLCRNNQPLIEVFLKLLKKKKKAMILGRDFGKGLLNVLSKVEDFSKESINEVLENKKASLKEKGITNFSSNESYVSLVEKLAILTNLYNHFEQVSVLRSTIEGMFGESDDGKLKSDTITLSTIHKSKGLESDNVYIVGFDELIPSKYAETTLDYYSEDCLKYVAISRAKNKLIFVPLNNI